jgi:hypothetical protein
MQDRHWTGGRTTIADCAMGIVSQACGGNAVKSENEARMRAAGQSHHRFLDAFYGAARHRDEPRMRAALDALRRDEPENVLKHRLFEAEIEKWMRRADQARAILDDVISSGMDEEDHARRDRAALALRIGDYASALVDIEIALRNKSQIGLAFEPDMLFRRATALAELGDRAFEVAVESLPDRRFYVPGRLLTPDDLREIYETRKAQREQGGAR